MEKIVIIDAKRSAIGKLNGSLSSLTAEQLGSTITRAILNETKLPADKIDQVIFGNAIQAGNGQNIARQIELNSNIPESKTAFTVNQVCGSGFKQFIKLNPHYYLAKHKPLSLAELKVCQTFLT